MAGIKDLPIQVKVMGVMALVYLTALTLATVFSTSRQKDDILHLAEDQAVSTANNYLDNLNTMMLTGTIGNRKILREKFLQKEEILAVRVMRSDALTQTLGPGFPEDHAVDERDAEALRGNPQQWLSKNSDGRVLTVIEPFRATTNTRGSNCLQCHMVPENSVLGAVRVSYSLASLDSSIHSSTLVSIGINATIFTLGMILLAFILKRILVNPITHLRDTMEGLRNDSDLKRRMPVTSEDELGQVASAFNHMLEMFQSIVGQISGTSGRLEEAAMQTSRVAESTSNGVERQQHEAGQVTSVMMELNSLVQDVATHTASSVEMARHADDQAEQGHNVMCETVTCLNNLAHEVDNAANTITELETASENIGAILDAIKGIADQTNLLALNAAIEAARAGEQGRGFAVVADEVRNLASRTEEATREIDKMIDSFRSDARRAVDVMSSGREQAQASISKADETNNRLNAIRIAVNEITQMNTQIATVAERQREVAEESAKNMESINAISRETAMGAGETTQASETITALSHELRVLVNKFAI